jgi:hypothetical protein
MSIRNPRELFVLMLSDLRQGTERTTKIFEEVSQIVEDPNIKEALEARMFNLSEGFQHSRPVL